MNSLEAGLQDEHGDDTGARAARAAAEALAEAAGHVRELAGDEDAVLLIGLQRRLTDATVAVEQLCDRQLSAAMIREAHRREDYAAGWEACLAFRRGLRSVS